MVYRRCNWTCIAGTTFVSDFVVIDMLGVDCIVGSDFLKKYGGVIDLSKNTLQFRNVMVPLEEVTRKTSSNHTDRCSHEHDELQVALVETLAIPPFSEVQAVAMVSSTKGTGTWLVEGSRFDLPILVVGALVTPLPDGQVPITKKKKKKKKKKKEEEERRKKKKEEERRRKKKEEERRRRRRRRRRKRRGRGRGGGGGEEEGEGEGGGGGGGGEVEGEGEGEEEEEEEEKDLTLTC